MVLARDSNVILYEFAIYLITNSAEAPCKDADLDKKTKYPCHGLM